MSDDSRYPSLPTDEESAAARECARVLSANLREGAETQQVEIVDDKGTPERMDVPISALKVFADILRGMGDGGVVEIVPRPADLSLPRAAGMFGVPYSILVEDIDKGEVPSYKVGSRRRVLYSDMVEYSERRNARIKKDREEFIRQAQASSPSADS